MSLFGFTTNEKKCVARLDAYLDTRDACIAYQECTRKASQKQNQTTTSRKFGDNGQNETGMVDILWVQLLAEAEVDQAEGTQEQEALPKNLEDKEQKASP